MGDFDTMSIRKCEVISGKCTELSISDTDIIVLGIQIVPGVQYNFTILLYQGNDLVLESEPFHERVETYSTADTVADIIPTTAQRHFAGTTIVPIVY